MVPYLRHLARVGCAISLLAACADKKDPTAPAADTSEVPFPGVSLSTQGPTPEELAEMPPEFATSPSIFGARTIVRFVPPDGVFAQGVMDYFATDAEQEVTLVLRFDNSEVNRQVAKGVEENFIPWMRHMRTTTTLPVPGECGYSATGHTQHRVHHKFLVGGWKFTQWGHDEDSSDGDDEQPECPPPPPPPGPGGDSESNPYNSGCEICQQWFWFEDGVAVNEWWECTAVDASVCTGGAVA